MRPFAKFILASFLVAFYSSAHADQIGTYLNATAEQLVKNGYKSSITDGVITLTKKDENIKIVSEPGKSVSIKLKNSSYGAYAKYFDLDSSGRAISKTRCGTSDPTSSKYTCTTQTGEYCKKLIATVKTQGFGVDTLKTCGKILEKIDSSLAPLYSIQSENVAKMKSKLDLDTTEFVTLERPARRSIESILEDYKECKTMEDSLLGDKWSDPAKPAAPAAPATRPVGAPVSGQN